MNLVVIVLFYHAAMNILVIGGTLFVGRHIVDASLARGHTITLFNRGQRNAELFAQVEKLRGDRNGDLSTLNGRRFDAVIDTCGYTPAQMQAMTKALGANVPHYVFVSSISAYGQFPRDIDYDESAALASGDTGYGEEKARAEEAIVAAYPNRVANVRPGLIVGPHDPTGRFVYWPLRAARGGTILSPGRAERPIQWIDVRDLAEWIVHVAEQRIVGAFNTVTPARAYTMRDLLESCVRVANVSASLHWIDDETLLSKQIAPWSELPLWIPESDADSGGLMLAKSERAVANGMRFRSPEETVSATLTWAQSLDPNDDKLGIRKTLSPEREAALLYEFSRT
jgi:2'-hydroxyisoflavone reductase